MNDCMAKNPAPRSERLETARLLVCLNRLVIGATFEEIVQGLDYPGSVPRCWITEGKHTSLKREVACARADEVVKTRCGNVTCLNPGHLTIQRNAQIGRNQRAQKITVERDRDGTSRLANLAEKLRWDTQSANSLAQALAAYANEFSPEEIQTAWEIAGLPQP